MTDALPPLQMRPLRVGKDGIAPITLVTDPMHTLGYSVGNSLWGASLECIQFLIDGEIAVVIDGGGSDEIDRRRCRVGTVDVDTDERPTSSLPPPPQRRRRTTPLNCLEVGAGCGAIGLCLWRHGARVTLTDRHATLPFLSRCISANSEPRQQTTNDRDVVVTSSASASVVIEEHGHHPPPPRLCAKGLDWRDLEDAKRVLAERGPFDLIIGSEVSYEPALHRNLIDTLVILAGGGGDGGAATKILLAVPERDDDMCILDHAAERGFRIRQVKSCPPSPDHSSVVGIYELSL